MRIRKVTETAPVEAQVVDNLTTNSSKDALSAKQGKLLNEKIQGTVLYNNSEGSKDTITLSDSAANYNRFQIRFKSERTGNEDDMIVNNPNGKTANYVGYFYGSYFYLECAEIQINGNQLTWLQNIRYRVASDEALSDYLLRITNVVGYNI